MYHVVNGSYFSQDLRDGQQLASILDMKPIQVGVRVDGCSRKYPSSLSSLFIVCPNARTSNPRKLIWLVDDARVSRP